MILYLTLLTVSSISTCSFDLMCIKSIINIECMNNVTAKYWYYEWFQRKFRYLDIIVCRWELNGIEYDDTITRADKDCKRIGYDELWSTLSHLD